MTIGQSGPLARRLADDLWVLDTRHLGEPSVIASYLIEGPDELALVDVGPASTAETVLDAVHAAGHDPRDVTRILLTHIHLDHAGATGTLLGSMPHARVYVHPLGAPHLADPTRLLTSAARIYGDTMQRWWGTMTPVPSGRIEVLRDKEEVVAGSRRLEVLYTPGHAVHHIAYFDARNAALFPGDAAGVRIEGAPYVRPPTPPPDLNLEHWMASIERMRGLSAARLYLPHFGVADAVDEHWQQLQSRLVEWGAFVAARMWQGLATDAIASALARHEDLQIERAVEHGEHGAAASALRAKYEHATNYQMTVEGYERYYRKSRPDLL